MEVLEIMNKSNCDMQPPLPGGEKKGTSQTPVTGTVSAEISDETLAWLARINKNMKRMSEDEEYRLTIAKDLS